MQNVDRFRSRTERRPEEPCQQVPVRRSERVTLAVEYPDSVVLVWCAFRQRATFTTQVSVMPVEQSGGTEKQRGPELGAQGL